MNIRVVGTLSRPFFARWGVAAILACAVGCAAAAPNPVSGPKSSEGYQTAAAHAILIEADSGSVLFEKAADDLIPPASLSKLMTQEVVFNEIRQGRLKPTTEFIVSTNAWRRGGAPSHTSSMFIPIHSKVSVDDLLHGAIIQSANDACIALAEGISGNESGFAELMTKRARELGLTKSTFGNSTGLPDPRQLMTSRELAKLARHIIETYPEYYKYYGEREFTWNKIRQFNRNPLLALNIGADGLKTGFTKEAGYGLVGSAVQNGLRLIVVVNGLRSEKERADEAKKMLDWGFHNFQSGLLFAQGQEIAQAKLYGGAKGHVPLTARKEVRLMVPRGSRDKIIARVVYSGPVPAPVQEGQNIGTLKVWRGESVVLEVPLQAAESVGTGSMPGRAFDAATELVLGLFRAGFKRL
ncbi:MAG: D-alanyl-D-alanine carboxypeptidase [Alphaproteobacteria bacterium]|jgi:serine-type D-Ala-D-Ala carboxypeptidase (penicillin-binding protein 5/6)|nr:MAG: D-alanyl-D-alanine carboxypeptidase [Alphaproteobacteria bacterium]